MRARRARVASVLVVVALMGTLAVPVFRASHVGQRTPSCHTAGAAEPDCRYAAQVAGTCAWHLDDNAGTCTRWGRAVGDAVRDGADRTAAGTVDATERAAALALATADAWAGFGAAYTASTAGDGVGYGRAVGAYVLDAESDIWERKPPGDDDTPAVTIAAARHDPEGAAVGLLTDLPRRIAEHDGEDDGDLLLVRCVGRVCWVVERIDGPPALPLPDDLPEGPFPDLDPDVPEAHPGDPRSWLPDAPGRDDLPDPPERGSGGPSHDASTRAEAGPIEPWSRADRAPTARLPDESRATHTRAGDRVPVPAPPVPGRSTLVLVSGLLAALGGVVVAIRLYRRVSKEDALDNDLRAAIVDGAREEPGVTPSELADVLDVARQTVNYHVRLLAELGILQVVRDGKYARLFVEGAHETEVQDLVAALRRDGRAAVLGLLRDDPGLCIAEIARRLGCHRSTAKHHVDALAEKGLVEEGEGDGRPFHLPPDTLESWDELGI